MKALYPLLNYHSGLSHKKWDSIISDYDWTLYYLGYAAPDWAYCAQTHLNSLQMVQNKCLRMAAHASYVPNRCLHAELKQELLKQAQNFYQSNEDHANPLITALGMSMEQRRNGRTRETEIPEKTRRPAVSPGTMPTRENKEASRRESSPVRLDGRRIWQDVVNGFTAKSWRKKFVDVSPGNAVATAIASLCPTYWEIFSPRDNRMPTDAVPQKKFHVRIGRQFLTEFPKLRIPEGLEGPVACFHICKKRERLAMNRTRKQQHGRVSSRSVCFLQSNIFPWRVHERIEGITLTIASLRDSPPRPSGCGCSCRRLHPWLAPFTLLAPPHVLVFEMSSYWFPLCTKGGIYQWFVSVQKEVHEERDAPYNPFTVTSDFSEALLKFYFQDIPPPRPIRVKRGELCSSARMQGMGKRNIPEKTPSTSRIVQYEYQARKYRIRTSPGFEPGSA
ncbi:hypothetical protein PR048_024111 [Dryococelus australis]|uniref:Uncharacterized protein n=1 Tax=Dryococelus australis TaxID=614101 RepID=A0ABQ9GW29_9NEOP|nr:hypothetical protein PR048_024111 [Dryococelus australis]